tara:strand:+ start:797 stop:1585 length:789 start_codon:yes stop_codon:yes gene_type:complete
MKTTQMKTPQIQVTNDYSLFTPNPLQRKFEESKVPPLAEKMKKNGFQPSMAISVYLHRGKLIINTGHHRLAAAELLGIPIFYIIESRWTDEQMIDEGTTVQPWQLLAVVQLFARKGKRDYQSLLNYADKGIPLGMAASMLIGNGAASNNTKKKVVAGTFRILDTKQADVFIDIFEEFSERQPTVKSRSFITALSKCILTKEFDLHTFKRRLRENPTMLGKTSNAEQMLKLLEDIYNFRANKKIPLAFMATAQSAKRGEQFGK